MTQRLSFEELTNLRENSSMTRQYEYETNFNHLKIIQSPFFSQGMII